MKLVTEVLHSELTVRQVLVTTDVLVPDELVAAASNPDNAAGGPIEIRMVTELAMERMASTTSPQPVLAEVEVPVSVNALSATVVDGASLALALVDVNDPGNVGTLARCAEAAGFDVMYVLGATADPWGPKAVRASAGSLFRLPVVLAAEAGPTLDALADAGFVRHGTRADDAIACDEADLGGGADGESRARVALILGSEAHGLSPDLAGHVDQWLAIPMLGDVESLNVAMAGAILCYEVARQRRTSADS